MNHLPLLLSLYLGAVMSNCAIVVNEYVAMAPSSASGKGDSIQWVAIEYEHGVSSADNVSLSLVTSAPPELGAWYGLDTGGLALTAKIVGDKLYALSGQHTFMASTLGCCADTLRIYARSGAQTSMKLETIVQKALNTTQAYVTHSLDVSYMPDGSLAAIFLVKYFELAIGNVYADAFVAVRISDGMLIRTADGSAAFSIYKAAGTQATDSTASRFRIQFYNSIEAKAQEQFHINGVQRFTSTDGISYLAFTHRFDAEAVILKDPFTYSSQNGGGLIVQRFGTPWLYTSAGSASAVRYFGLASSARYFDSGVHNVFYTSASTSASLAGKQTISLFVNSQDGKSAAYEFAFNPVQEGSEADTGDDTVFDVDYVFATCTFTANSAGGARPIGDGVFLVSSGSDATGLEVVDSSGSSKSQAYALEAGRVGFYDPFIRVMATTLV